MLVSGRVSCSVGLSQNQGLVVLGGQVGKQLVSYFPSKLKRHGINTSSVHCCSQREGSFVGLLHTKNILKSFCPHGFAEIRMS